MKNLNNNEEEHKNMNENMFLQKTNDMEKKFN